MTLKPFEQIVTALGPVVLRVCRAILGPADAEDAWSETFLAALSAYPELAADSNVEAWLVTIAHRKALDHLRAEARRPVPTEKLPETPAPQDVPDGPAPELWDALKALPPKQREAVAYHYIAGMPYSEIAAILGNNEAAARRASADGMKRLRAAYGKGNTDES
jgi:RNA polymerase sigma factor (sigma-70 family)